MVAYILRRLLLMIPTLLGIMVINFVIIQVAPGGPVEQMIAEIQGTASSATDRISGGSAASQLARPDATPAGGGGRHLSRRARPRPGS